MASDYWQPYTGTRTTRRRFIQAGATAAVGAAGLALTGCGDDGDAGKPTATAAETPGAGPTAEKPLRGGTLRFPFSNDSLASGNPPTLFPFEAGQGVFLTQAMSAFHYSRLMRAVAGADIAFEDRTVLEGDLASGFEQVDPLTYRFTIRPNAKWQNKAPLNGRAVTATDFLKSYEAFLKTPVNSFSAVGRFASNVVDKVDAPDEKTVVFRLKSPHAPFLSTMAASDQGPWLVPVETIESGQAKRDPVGSGPFIFREFLPGVALKWDRNPDYYDAPLPNFDKAEARLGISIPRQIAGLESGEFDVSGGLGGALYKEIHPRLNPAGKEGFPQSAVAGGLHFNFDNRPFQDKHVRQAISLILDRGALTTVQDATGKGAWQAHLPPGNPPFYLNPESPSFGANARYYQRNLTEAKALLSAAGAEGLKFRLICSVDVYGPIAKQTFELIAAQLQEAGLQPELVFQTYTTYIKTTFLGQMPGDAAGVGPFIGTIADPDDLFTKTYWTRASARPVWGGTPIPEQASIDADIEKQRTILDTKERVAFIHEMQRKMAESMLTVPYHSIAGYTYAQPWMKNTFGKAGYAYLPDGLMKASFTADRIAKG